MNNKPVFLIADDEAILRQGVSQALGRTWKVIGCKSRNEVVEVLPRLDKVDVALLDLSLDSGDVYISTEELVQALRDKGAQVGLYTGYVDRETVDLARELGAQLFYKPRVDFEGMAQKLINPGRGGHERGY